MRRPIRRNREAPLNVCWQCIGEDIVSAEIRAEQPRRTCSYCRTRRAAILIADLARRVDPVFQNIVGEAEAGFVVRDGNPDWAPNGEYPSQIMTEILEADTDEIGRDLVSVLAERHRFNVNDGGFDYYDDTSDIYTILDAEDDRFGRGWESFCDELKHQRRFFLDQSAHVLDEIFGPILREEWPPGSAIRTIGPDTDYTHIFRARDANERDEQEKIYRQRRRQLGAPPPGVAGSGRMNAAGISVFYGSFEGRGGGSAVGCKSGTARPHRSVFIERAERAAAPAPTPPLTAARRLIDLPAPVLALHLEHPARIFGRDRTGRAQRRKLVGRQDQLGRA